jgi:hypothetical protein
MANAVAEAANEGPVHRTGMASWNVHVRTSWCWLSSNATLPGFWKVGSIWRKHSGMPTER